VTYVGNFQAPPSRVSTACRRAEFLRASCRGAMTPRTGTSRNGQVHRYYTCSTCAPGGKTACNGRSIRMDKLDTLVTSHLADRLLEPQRLAEMLTSLAGTRAAKLATIDARIAALEWEAHEANERLRRLYKLVEDGLAEMDGIFKDRVAALKGDRDVHAGIRKLWSCCSVVQQRCATSAAHAGQLQASHG
jgi:hypothetical protein